MQLAEFDGETLWVTYRTETGKVYYITSDSHRDTYHLWKQTKDKPSRMKYESTDPLDLYSHCKG